MFLKNQRKWESPSFKEDDITAFREACIREKYDPAMYVPILPALRLLMVEIYYRMDHILLILRIQIKRNAPRHMNVSSMN